MIKSFRAYYIECDKCGSRHHSGSVGNTRGTAQENKAFQVKVALSRGWRKEGRKFFCHTSCKS